jgi:uncharacterized protein YcbX
MMIRLQEIIRFPIKGFSGEKLENVHLSRGEGLPFDRRIAFTNGQGDLAPGGAWTPCGAFVRLTKNSDLPRYRVSLDEAEGSVVLSHPSGQRVQFSLRDAASLDAAARNITEWFPASRRDEAAIARSRPDIGYWDHDDAALSIINLDSVAQLAEAAGVTIDPARFRGNLHIAGGGAWTEFDLVGRRLRIGDAELEILRPIDRCSAPSVSPTTSEVDLNIPATLARLVGHIYCGVYARV